jgi:hypothetical protein
MFQVRRYRYFQPARHLCNSRQLRVVRVSTGTFSPAFRSGGR